MKPKTIDDYANEARNLRVDPKSIERLARADMYIAIAEFFRGLTVEQKADAVAKANRMLDEFERKYGDKL